jgi:hypothetical protein
LIIRIIDYLNYYNETDLGNKTTLTILTHILREILSSPQFTTTDDDSLFNGDVISYLKNLQVARVIIKTLTKLTMKNFSESDEPILCNLLLSCACLSQWDVSEKYYFNENVGVRIPTRIIRQLIYHPAHERHMNPL